MKLLLFLFLNIQAFAVPQGLEGYCGDNPYFSEFVVKTVFEKNFCHRMYPKSIKESLDENHDFPHSEIDLSVTSKIEIKKNDTTWKSSIIITPIDEKFHLNDEEIFSAIDWDEILSFNIKAKKIVENSNSKDFITDFYKNKLNRKTRESLISLNQDMERFFSSTDFTLTYGLGAISQFHPLFTELLLLQFYYIHKNNSGLLNGNHKWLSFPEMSEFKNAPLTLELINYFLYDKKDSFSRISKLTDNEDSQRPKHQFSNTLMFVNIGSLLATISDQDCSHWGFKPATHRQFIQGLFSQYKNFEGEDLFRPIIENNIKACGSIMSRQDDRPYPISVYFSDIREREFEKKYDLLVEIFEKYRP